ncbi:uncharacterized protein [Procambarus clarkii]|uniref:uncharacterized protein isoform X2 n=1 Tax=Procambarus clarkii TaxID=6728 RepID=UPI001E670F80|nr:uncharacterized protein LOC123747288 isoform X2 [Procambarus clarkii]
MEEKASKRKSILKGQSERTETKKRLSFASSADFSQTSPDSPVVGTRRHPADIVPTNIKSQIQDLEVTPLKKHKKQSAGSVASQSQASQSNSQLDLQDSFAIAVPTCKSVRRTAMGLCYSPEETSVELHTHHQETIPLKDNKRNNFVTALQNTYRTRPTANVLVIGDKHHGQRIKDDLLWQHNLQKTPSSEWNIILNIICEENPPTDILPNVHFFIFLVRMDEFHSLTSLSNVLTKINDSSVPPKRMLVLSVSTSHELHKNVIDLEEFAHFLDRHQMINFPWEEQSPW